MATSGNSIGSISVSIVADQSKLNSGINAAVQTAQAGGDKIANALNASAIKVSTLQLSVDTLRQKYDSLAQSGVRTAAAQQEMDNVARRLEISQQRLALALNQVGQAAGHAVTQMQAVSGTLRTIEGSGGIRAVEAFITKTLGLGPAIQAIFPVVGAIAFGEILTRVGSEAYEFFQRAINYSRDFQIATNELNDELRITNTELALSTDRLNDEIAKLSGHPSNGLATLLDEATLSAEKLNRALSADLDKIDELLKKQSVGPIEGLFTGRASTAPNEQSFSDSDAKAKLDIDRITRTQDALISGAKLRAESASTEAQKKKALDDADAARADARNQIQKVFISLVNDTIAAIQESERQQKNAPAPTTLVTGGFGAAQSTTTSGISYADVTQQATTRLEALQNIEQQILATYENTGAQQKKTIAQLGKESAEAAKKAAEDWLKVQKDGLEDLKLNSVVTINAETDYWNQRLAIAQSRGPAYADAVRTIQQDLLRLRTQGIEANRRADAEDLKALDEHIKVAQEAAKEAGRSPGAAKLQLLNEAQTVTTPEVSTEKLGAIQSQIPAAESEANRDAVESIKRGISEIDQAWQLTGEHSAEEARRNAAEWVAFLQSLRGYIVGIDPLIDEWGNKLAGATRKAEEEARKLADSLAGVQIKGQAQSQTAALDQEKLTLEQAYGAQVVKTYQDQINYADQLAVIETKRLQIKLLESDAALFEAAEENDLLKVSEELLKNAQARSALALQQQAAAGAHAKSTRDTSFGGQVAAGLNSDVDSAFAKTSKAITDMITQTKNWGQEFHKVLKSIEDEIVNTLVGSALKQLENAGKAVFKGILDNVAGGTGGGIAAELAKVFGSGSGGKNLPGGGVVGGGVLGTNVGAAGGLGGVLGVGRPPQQNPTLNQISTELTTTNQLLQELIEALQQSVVAQTQNTPALTANTSATTTNSINVALNTVALLIGDVLSIFGGAKAAGGPVSQGNLHLVGEKGPELFVPDSAGTIIPADKTSAILSQVGAPPQTPAARTLGIPDTPSVFSGSSEQRNALAAHAAGVTNQNTGRIGDNHYNIYGANNAREVMRQIADFEKRQTGQYSPANS